MSRHKSAGSIFWGLVLIAAGAVFLARNFGYYDIPLWTGIALYWPVLIIVWGVAKLIDHIQRRASGERRALFSFGEVLLLIVLVLGGTAITTTANMSPDLLYVLELADIDVWELAGAGYDYTERHEAEAFPGASIEIINRYGSVEVRPADVDRIVVDVSKTVIAPDQAAADRLAETLTFSIRNEFPGYRIVSSFNRDENLVRGRRFRTSLVVQVPRESSIQIDNRNGRVTIAGLTGNQRISNSFGEVVVREITGALEIDNRNGAVTAEQIGGSVTIENAFAATTVRGVQGDLQIDNRNGFVEASDVTGDADISNSFASIAVTNVSGAVAISGTNNAVRVVAAGGDLQVESAFQNIDIREPGGAVRVDNRNGDVRIAFTQPPAREVSVSSQFSNVVIDLPSDAAFNADLETEFGEISSDFNLGVTSNGPARSVNQRVGEGGPVIRIDTRNGSIRLNGRG